MVDIPPSLAAPIQTVNLEALKSNSTGELVKLIYAARQDGVFYLDLEPINNGKTDGDTHLSELVEGIYTLARSLFSMRSEEKLKYDVDKLGSLKRNGYKPIGRNVGGIKGQRDGFESYTIPGKAAQLSAQEIYPRPPIIDEYLCCLEQLSSTLTDAAKVIFKTLSMALLLPEEQSLDSFHRPSQPLLDIIRLLKYAANTENDSLTIPQTAHTDMGSLTFLFCDSPGLQILPEGSNEWLYVLPKPGRIVVNFGDVVSTLTNGFVRSVLHRVASLPGCGMEERYSFALLMRPEALTPMQAIPSPFTEPSRCQQPVKTFEEWLSAKFGALRGSHKAESELVVTGTRKEFK